MAANGVIAERARGILPITWDALVSDPRFGDDLIQQAVNIVKESVFGTVVPPEQEANYPLIVIDYAAKLVALEIIPAGIDFWMNQPLSESATGTNENHTFVDRAEALRKLRDDLLEETRKLAPDIEDLVGYRKPSGRAVPLMNTGNADFITPNPYVFPRPFAAS